MRFEIAMEELRRMARAADALRGLAQAPPAAAAVEAEEQTAREALDYACEHALRDPRVEKLARAAISAIECHDPEAARAIIARLRARAQEGTEWPLWSRVVAALERESG
jgi:hypothetical protein